MDLIDKYNYDIDILSISFEYYKDDEILDCPKLIILCKKAKFEYHNNKCDFTGYYYFKIIFIRPSKYSINIKSSEKTTMSIKEMNNPQKTYEWTYPFVCNINKIKSTTNHSCWEISFDYQSKKVGYIIIYADDLTIEEINNPL